MRTARPTDCQTNDLPAMHTKVALNRTFSLQEMEQIRRGVVPQQMEDKWFVYWQDDTLFFHRSWTGNCMYVVRFTAEGDTYRMVEAKVNRDPEQYSETDDEADVRLISFLVDVLLLHRPADFPCDESESDQQAIMAWSCVGRAMFNQHPDDQLGTDQVSFGN